LDVVLRGFGSSQLSGSGDLLNLLFSEGDVDVLRLKVGVDDLTHPVHVVETDEALSSQSPDKGKRDTFVFVPLDDLEEVDAKNFEHHDEVFSIWTVVNERVQKLSAVGRLRDHAKLVEARLEVWIVFVVALDTLGPLFGLPVLSHLVEDIDFIVCSLYVVLGTLLDFQGNVRVVLEILSEPNSREVAPAELLDDDIAVHQDLADVDRVVASYLVVGHALIFRAIVVLIERFIQHVLQRLEVLVHAI